jgi:hypothetical protein
MFPRMSENELRALGEDIKANGLTSPIAITRSKSKNAVGWTYRYQLLDGRSRLDAMEAVGIGFNLEFVAGDCTIIFDDDAPSREATIIESDPYAYVVSANIHRRHLRPEQRQNLLIEVIARSPTKSDRQIGKEVGVDHKTIGHARRKGEDVGRVPHVETHTDTKGRTQPAHRQSRSPQAVADDAEATARESERRRKIEAAAAAHVDPAAGNGVDPAASAAKHKAEAAKVDEVVDALFCMTDACEIAEAIVAKFGAANAVLIAKAILTIEGPREILELLVAGERAEEAAAADLLRREPEAAS